MKTPQHTWCNKSKQKQSTRAITMYRYNTFTAGYWNASCAPWKNVCCGQSTGENETVRIGRESQFTPHQSIGWRVIFFPQAMTYTRVFHSGSSVWCFKVQTTWTPTRKGQRTAHSPNRAHSAECSDSFSFFPGYWGQPWFYQRRAANGARVTLWPNSQIEDYGLRIGYGSLWLGGFILRIFRKWWFRRRRRALHRVMAPYFGYFAGSKGYIKKSTSKCSQCDTDGYCMRLKKKKKKKKKKTNSPWSIKGMNEMAKVFRNLVSR